MLFRERVKRSLIQRSILIFNKININPKIYAFVYFKILSKFLFSRVTLYKLESSFFKIKEVINNKVIYWGFPIELTTRGIGCYTFGLKDRAIGLAKSYKINEINFSDEDIIIDCGANFGDLWLYLNNLQTNLNYIGIEPGKLEYKTLDFNLKLNKNSNVSSKSFQFALGCKNDDINFYYSPERADSSIIKPTNYVYTYKAKVLTLDKFISENNLSGKIIKLLKLEAEGFEPEIISGSKEALKNIKYIAADLGPERGESEDCTLAEVTSLLQDNGFKIKYFGYPRITAVYENENI